MKLITSIPYQDVNFIWISDHWDWHLHGTCYHNNQLCEFKTIEGVFDFDEENEDWIEKIPTMCEIYSLTYLEKLQWKWRQFQFEQCVGYHWTYPYRKAGERPFYYRKPKWLYKFIFKIYYGIQSWTKSKNKNESYTG